VTEGAELALDAGDVLGVVRMAVADRAGDLRRRLEKQAGAARLVQQPIVDRALGWPAGIGIAVDFEPVLFLKRETSEESGVEIVESVESVSDQGMRE
jgi:hypothetical protein